MRTRLILATLLAIGFAYLYFSKLAKMQLTVPNVIAKTTDREWASMRFEDVAEEAKRVFVGHVLSIRIKDPGVREVRLAVENKIRGNLGKELVVNESIPFADPIEVGVEVFWLLPLDSEIGLALPIGGSNGDFQVTRTDPVLGKMVKNGNENRGLWDRDLWEESQRGIIALSFLARRLPNDVVQKIAAFGDSPPGPEIPLELLIAFVQTPPENRPKIP
jgi:hypothetical protein